MNKIIRLAAGIICLSAPAIAQTTFTSGNLVVLQTSGTTSKSSSQAVLKEFTTGGTAGMTVSIPTTGPTPFQTGGVFGGSEGFLSTSTDGKYIVLGGYATSASFSDITATSSASVARAIGLVYPSGFYLQVDTSNTFYSANDIRGGISDGTNFWASGASNPTDGIDYFYPGAHAALAAAATPPKAYGLRIFNGNIYYSTQKAGPSNTVTQLGIYQLGSGLPTSGTVTVSQVINTGSVIPEDFSFNPAGNVCYIAVNLNTSAGGIQKWTKTGSTWSLAYTLGTGITNIGAYGLVADYTGTVPVIYATTFDGGGNRIIKVSDSGTLASSTVSTLVAATSNVFYKGITFAPVASGTPIVNLSVNKDTASEAAVSVITVTANTSAPVTGNQTVTLAVSGTGITSGDYTLSNTTITIPSGATSGSVTFTVVDDTLGENTEVALLSISSPSSGITLGMRPTQKISIADNDGNNHPTITMKVATTTDYIDNAVTTPPSSPFKLSGVISDPTDPGSTLGIDFTVYDAETPDTSLILTARSLNTSVVSNANVVLTGTGATRNLKITPSGVGYADIKLVVNDGLDSSVYIINYAASAASDSPSKTNWPTGISDASDAIALDDNYYITGDDELNVLNVYSRSNSGLPALSYNYTSNLALPDPGKPEVDLEAATRSLKTPNKMYWMGSMSNSKAPFDVKPNRDRIFATTVSGTGASTAFTFVSWDTLRSSILAWGDANGYGFSASAAAGVDSKSTSGFAAEGMVFGPDTSTLYIGLRAPLVPTTTRTKAVIVPIPNFETWFNTGRTTGRPTIGAPIELDLGGRGIREMTRLSNGTYIILAGSSGDVVRGAIYTWTGWPSDAPVMQQGNADTALNMEGVMQINTGGSLSLSSLQIITDKGGDVLYNDGTEAKEFGDLILRKFRTDIISYLDLFVKYPEITLKGNGLVINNGDMTPRVADNTDFWEVNPGGSDTRTFSIRNEGPGRLVVAGISFTGSNASEFTLVGAPSFPFTVDSGHHHTITVKFSPHAAGIRTAIMQIRNSDLDEGLYSVALQGHGECEPYYSYISVNPSPTVAGQEPNTIFLGYGPSSVTLKAHALFSYPPYTYSWSPVSSTDSTVTVSPTHTTAYTVHITNAYGCPATAYKTIEVEDVRDGQKILVCHNGHTISVASSAVAAHLAHGDDLGSCFRFFRTVGGTETSDAVKVYPNPAKDKFTVEFTNTGTSEIIITDITGVVVERREIINAGPQIQQFDLGQMPKGVYLIKVSGGDNTYQGKIVIE